MAYKTDSQFLEKCWSSRNDENVFVPLVLSCAFSVRRASDLSRRIAATFDLQHDEKLFGCGESFTRFNKRGQRVLVSTRDGMGTQNEYMYKPIPFFLSSNGYGMFVHTSAPLSFDFGKYFDGHNVIYSGDENLDLFVFLGRTAYRRESLGNMTRLWSKTFVAPWACAMR